MGRLTKDALLSASDLREKEVELETLNGSVVVQGLGAAFSNQAQSEALEMKTIGNTQIATVNVAVVEEIQVLHGLKDPRLESREEARKFLERCGPAAKKVVAAIDELSGVDKETMEDVAARFPSSSEEPARDGEAGANGASAGSGRPPVPVRAGARSQDVDSRDHSRSGDAHVSA